MFTTAFLQYSGKGPLRLAGDMDAMHGAMRQLAITIPDPDDYPAPLRPFLHRRVWKSTLGEVERAVESGSTPPVFVKPARRRKNSTGTVCYSDRDFATFGYVSRRQPVWCSEVVTWRSEYRVYIIDQRIMSVDHYAGDDSPTGETALVEANDGYALGAYKIPADAYTDLITRRWDELLEVSRR